MPTVHQDISQESDKALIARLMAENEALKAGKGKITLKVSGKGAVSVYGMGQFPVSLYKEQWLRLLDEEQAIREFIKANDKIMAVKGQAPSPELIAHAKVVAAATEAREKARKA